MKETRQNDLGRRAKVAIRGKNDISGKIQEKVRMIIKDIKPMKKGNQRMVIYSLTHSLTHSFTSLPSALTRSLNISRVLTHLLPGLYDGDHVFGVAPVYNALTANRRNITELLIQEVTHSLTHSLTHPPTYLLTLYFVDSLGNGCT